MLFVTQTTSRKYDLTLTKLFKIILKDGFYLENVPYAGKSQYRHNY